MIHEILISVVADDADRAHEVIAQLAESRGSEILEAAEQLISTDEGDAIEGFCVQARLTAGTTA